ncbi:transposase [Pseudomonas jessenii]
MGRMRHGLRTKYVDACRTSVALVGDYSPRTERILPLQNPFGKPSFSKKFYPRLAR